MVRGGKRPFSSRGSFGAGSRGRPSSHQPRRPSTTLSPNDAPRPVAAPAVAIPPLSIAVPTDTPRFADLASNGLLHPTLAETIVNDLKFDHMMPVQAATLPDLLQKKDCLAQAKTGTGKTMAFLLPAIQSFLNGTRARSAPISLLVLSPTRELAMQIAKEAERLLQRMPNYKVKVAIGGTNKDREFKAILQGCNILVATPGRLLDHLADEEMRHQLSQIDTLVLDEADRMLDMGFLPDVKRIISLLPDKTRIPRHSMLFSATIEGQIQDVAHLILNKDFKFISTVAPGENNTHERVPQFLIKTPSMVELAPALVAAVRSEKANASAFKAIVFAPTAAQADFYSHVLAGVQGLPPTSTLHSRMAQGKRTKITENFRQATSAICVATDVIARGMDFPNVSHVFQVGLPSDRASYIHRLGRTARAAAEGRGILVLAEQETAFLHQLKGVKVQEYQPLTYSIADIRSQLSTLENKEKVYQAWLGYYKTFMKTMRWTPEELVRQANTFAIEGLLCPEVPALERKTIGKMGLKGVPGLVAAPNAPGSSDPRRRGGGGGRRGPPGK